MVGERRVPAASAGVRRSSAPAMYSVRSDLWMAFHAEIGTLRKLVSESCSGVQDGLGGSVAETLTRWTSDRTALRNSVSEIYVSCESFESCSGVQDPLGGSVVGTLWWRSDRTGTAFFALWLAVLLERWDALDFEVPMVEMLACGFEC